MNVPPDGWCYPKTEQLTDRLRLEDNLCFECAHLNILQRFDRCHTEMN